MIISLHAKVVVFNDLTEAPENCHSLLMAAKVASELAYAPYSDFQVGASILTEQRKIFSGSNIENASFPLCLCAERTAFSIYHSNAVNEKIEAMAIYAHSLKETTLKPAFPCGACRQVIAEFIGRQKMTFPLYTWIHTGKIYYVQDAMHLLPMAFSKEDFISLP